MTEPFYYKNVVLYRYLLNPYYNATIDDVLFEDYFFDKLHYKPFDHFTIHETRPEPTQFYSIMDKQVPVINEKIPFDEWHSITWELDNEKKPKSYRLALKKNTRNLDPVILKENEVFMTYEECEAAAKAKIAKIEDDLVREADEVFYYEVSRLPISEPEKKRLSQLPHSYGFSFRRHENSILFRPSRDKVIQH